MGFYCLIRAKGRLVATSEANILYKETREVYRQVAKLRSTVDNLKNPEHGKFRIVSVAALGLEAIPKVNQKYRAKYKDAQFIYQTHHYNDLVTSLLEYGKDIGFALNPPPHEGIAEIKIGDGELVCIYQNDEFDDYPDRLKLSDLEGHDFVSIEASGPLGDILSDRMAREDHHFNSKLLHKLTLLPAIWWDLVVVSPLLIASPRNHRGPESLNIKVLNPPMKFAIKALHVEDQPLSKAHLDFLEFLKKNIEL